MEKDEDDVIKWLTDMGILKDLGFNEDIGQNLYYIDPSISDFFPSFKSLHKEDMANAVFDLWNLEMIDLSFDENGEPLISLNKNSFDEEKIDLIDDENLKTYLFLIRDVFEKHFK